MKKFFTLGLALSLSLIAISVRAQVTTGTVKGIVNDPNGAVVTGAKVTIVKKSNNETHTGQTSGSGTFQFDNLLIGDDYTVTVEATKDRKSTRLNSSHVSESRM